VGSEADDPHIHTQKDTPLFPAAGFSLATKIGDCQTIKIISTS
jgi:hypothetical protein